MQTTKSRLTITAIIPTKNRAPDLALAVRSIMSQTVLPEQLIVVDQNHDDLSTQNVMKEFGTVSRIQLDYVHDPSITGLATARNRAMELAIGDIWLFLDDDVVMEPEFIEQLLEAYRNNVHAGGISGIITNYRPGPIVQRLWTTIFARGRFRDERQPIYWAADQIRNREPIQVGQFTGALMSYRASLIRELRFDTNLTGVSLGEDTDFCWRLPLGTQLLIAPSARLVHNRSLLGRPSDHWLRAHAQSSYYLFERNLKDKAWNRICFAWLRVGYGVATALTCAKRRSLEGWYALRTGRSIGKSYANPQVGVTAM